jgi:GGDEF domain-containing protein
VDICGRYSEEGFLYLIDRDATPRSLWSLCERLALDLSFEVNFENASFTLATNMGMALFPLDGESAQEVLAAAELALTRARGSGVPCSAAWPPTVRTEGPISAADADAAGLESGTGCAVATRRVDRRSERRHRVVKHGKVISGENNSIVECRIRDISNGGARITVNEYYSPPDQFVLLMMGTGEKRGVTVRWRIGNNIGVQYLP